MSNQAKDLTAIAVVYLFCKGFGCGVVATLIGLTITVVMMSSGGGA